MVSKTAPHPTPAKAGPQPASDIDAYFAARNQFMNSVLNMTWQLALVVLIPVVGGFKLDEHFKSSPLWTLIGFAVAVSGVALVLWRVVQQANAAAGAAPKEKSQ